MERRGHTPGNALRENLSQIGEPIARGPVPRRIAENEQPSGRNLAPKAHQQGFLICGGEIMQHIQNRHVAAERRRLFSDVMLPKFELAITGVSNFRGVADFSPIEIQSDYRLLKRALAQIEAEKTEPAADIEQGFARTLQEFVDRRICRVAS